MAFVHVGRRGSGRATRLTRSTAREARPRRRGGDLVRSGAPDMSGISRQSEKPRGIPDSVFPASRGLGLTLHSILSVWCSLSGLVWSGLVWSGLVCLIWSWFRLTVVLVLVLVLGLLDT